MRNFAIAFFSLILALGAKSSTLDCSLFEGHKNSEDWALHVIDAYEKLLSQIQYSGAKFGGGEGNVISSMEKLLESPQANAHVSDFISLEVINEWDRANSYVKESDSLSFRSRVAKVNKKIRELFEAKELESLPPHQISKHQREILYSLIKFAEGKESDPRILLSDKRHRVPKDVLEKLEEAYFKIVTHKDNLFQVAERYEGLPVDVPVWKYTKLNGKDSSYRIVFIQFKGKIHVIAFMTHEAYNTANKSLTKKIRSVLGGY